MKFTSLKDLTAILKKEADRYVSMLADIGGGYVELVDLKGRIISKAGKLVRNSDSKDQDLPLAYKDVIKSKSQVIIKNGQANKLLSQCPVFKASNIQGLIATPIIVDGKVLGILGTTIKEINKESLAIDFDLYTVIARQTAGFISISYKNIKDREEHLSTLDIFEIVVRNMEEGAIVIDDQNRIQIINKSAKAQLGIDWIIDQDSIAITKTGDKLADSEEFKIKIANLESTVFGTIFQVPDNHNYNSIILFKDIQAMKSSIYEATSTTINVADLDKIIGRSKETKKLKEDIVKVAPSISTVLVTGESGTGKEMVATAIWKNSDRKNERFVAINCAAIPEALLESELFGYVKGAFTSADPRGRMGKFELANKGVIFLDEIGDMPLYLQSKILRVIQEKKISRIGSNQVIPLDVRIIAATNQDLREMIKQNTFREDLYYRLNVIPIEISPLRQRPDDIKELFYYYIKHYSNLFGKTFTKVDKDVIEKIIAYPWPGNVRELENACEYMVNMMEFGQITLKTLPRSIYNPYNLLLKEDQITPLEKLEQKEILKALNIFGTNTRGKEEAAKALGIGIATLYRKIQGLDLDELK
ncbi:MAG: sigma 54-interacting transcriptional regulator [Bacillota bacterium]|nr:sigma 54-interacting transcriptional regulator [Bacillota bacterium]